MTEAEKRLMERTIQDAQIMKNLYLALKHVDKYCELVPNILQKGTKENFKSIGMWVREAIDEYERRYLDV
jgi:hypothetical protein